MNKIHFSIAASTAAVLISMAGAAGAQTTSAPAAAATSTEMAEGEVRKVDKENQKLTIKHGPLTNLDMPGMTMVFQVQDAAMLDKVQAGDKVRFVAEKLDGKFTVTKMDANR
ncbi:copper-binding protein [Variovorax sp. RHLX14]|uniref:copper-binding protein n=1 Tax=Variovorax sp. RHLX14 TaxID=1259731 RepID=UPI003F476201